MLFNSRMAFPHNKMDGSYKHISSSKKRKLQNNTHSMILSCKVQNQAKPNYIFQEAYRWYKKNKSKKIISIEARRVIISGRREMPGLGEGYLGGRFQGASVALCLKWCLFCDFVTTVCACMCFSLLYSQQNILKHGVFYVIHLILPASPQFHVWGLLSNLSLILGGMKSLINNFLRLFG